MDNKGKSSISIWWIIYIVGFIIVWLLALIPNNTPHQDVSLGRRQSCYSNIRVLLGATEMYNMDTDNMVTKMDLRFASSLKAKNYLKDTPKCPETNSFDYSSEGDLTNTGYIYCKSHGGVDRGKGEIEKKEESSPNYKIDQFIRSHPFTIVAITFTIVAIISLFWPLFLILYIIFQFIGYFR